MFSPESSWTKLLMCLPFKTCLTSMSAVTYAEKFRAQYIPTKPTNPNTSPVMWCTITILEPCFCMSISIPDRGVSNSRMCICCPHYTAFLPNRLNFLFLHGFGHFPTPLLHYSTPALLPLFPALYYHPVRNFVLLFCIHPVESP